MSNPNKRKDKNTEGGFSKKTDYKWLGVGIVVFILIAFLLPLPESMLQKASDIFPDLSQDRRDFVGSPESLALHIQYIVALLAMCTVFFATEAIPMPAVASVSYTHLTLPTICSV